MHAVRQYLLNLFARYPYTGSGTVFVGGSANVVVKNTYTGSGYIYIDGAAGVKTKFLYTGTGKIYLYGSAGYVFKPNLGEVIVKYGINEWVYDLEHHIWQIKSIYGTPEKIYYICFNGQYEKTFEEQEIIAFIDGYEYFSNLYNNKAQTYDEIISQINQIIAVTPDVPATPGNLLIKYKLGEYVYDSNKNIWQIIVIENTPTRIQYVARNATETRVFDQDELIDFVGETPYFISKYNEQIASYADTIANIEAILIQKYG